MSQRPKDFKSYRSNDNFLKAPPIKNDVPPEYNPHNDKCEGQVLFGSRCANPENATYVCMTCGKIITYWQTREGIKKLKNESDPIKAFLMKY